nr:thioesterase [Vibrio anguillarum]
MNQVFKTLYQSGAQPLEIWIICPFAGGSLSAFKTWMSLDCNALAKETLVLLATYPGRDHRMRERPLTSIEAIAEDVAEGLRTWIADQTFIKET